MPVRLQCSVYRVHCTCTVHAWYAGMHGCTHTHTQSADGWAGTDKGTKDSHIRKSVQWSVDPVCLHSCYSEPLQMHAHRHNAIHVYQYVHAV